MPKHELMPLVGMGGPEGSILWTGPRTVESIGFGVWCVWKSVVWWVLALGLGHGRRLTKLRGGESCHESKKCNYQSVYSRRCWNAEILASAVVTLASWLSITAACRPRRVLPFGLEDANTNVNANVNAK